MQFRKQISDDKLQGAIDSLYSDLAGHTAETAEYAAIVNQLEKLEAVRQKSAKPRVSPDTLVLASANLFGIAMIIGHERANLITSKSLMLVRKLL